MATAAPLKVSIVMTNFQKASAVMEGLSAARPFLQMVPGVDKLFPGGPSDTDRILQALEALGSRIQQGLNDVKQAINDKTQLDRWERNREKLLGYQERVIVRARELESLTPQEDEVLVNGIVCSIADWCEGFLDKGKHTTGVLEELGTILNGIEAWLGTTDADGKTAIDHWEQLVVDGVAGRVFKLEGETRFGLMFMWYQYVSSLVQSAVFVRNAALALYQRRAENPQPKYVNSDAVLKKLGNVANPDRLDQRELIEAHGRWADFSAKFEAYLALGVREDHIGNVVAREAFQNPAHTQTVLRARNQMFWIDCETIADDNSYFAGLQLAMSDTGGWHLAATQVSLLPGGRTKVTRVSGLDRLVKSGVTPKLISFKDAHVVGTGYASETLARELANREPEATIVVTGAAIRPLANGTMVIALRYGLSAIVDEKLVIFTKPDMPWAMPSAEGLINRMWISRSVLSPAVVSGERCDIEIFDTGSVETSSLLPLTNATFGQVNEHMTIQGRFGWDAYKALQFQPAALTRFSPPDLPRRAGIRIQTQPPLPAT